MEIQNQFNLNEYIPDCPDSRKTGSNYIKDTIKIYQNILSRIYSEYFIDGRPIRGVSNLASSSSRTSLISVKIDEVPRHSALVVFGEDAGPRNVFGPNLVCFSKNPIFCPQNFRIAQQKESLNFYFVSLVVRKQTIIIWINFRCLPKSWVERKKRWKK